MTTTSPSTPERILAAARRVLSADPTLSLDEVAREAGISRATIHRHFASRADLLAAAGIVPDADTRSRVVAAAAGLIARYGLSGMSLDDVAIEAGVSRASVYRNFAGKAALFEAVVEAYSPFARIVAHVGASMERPPAEVVPELYRVGAEVVAQNIELYRALVIEVAAGSEEAVEGITAPLGSLLACLCGYVSRQMELGELPARHPMVAVQAAIGPFMFHLLTRPVARRVAGFDIPFETAAEQLGIVALGGLMTPVPSESHQEG